MPNEKCYCGHAKRNHRSIAGIIGAGLRLYTGCKYCDCLQYSPKSAGLEEWVRLATMRSEVYGSPLPSIISDIKRSK